MSGGVATWGGTGLAMVSGGGTVDGAGVGVTGATQGGASTIADSDAGAGAGAIDTGCGGGVITGGAAGVAVGVVGAGAGGTAGCSEAIGVPHDLQNFAPRLFWVSHLAQVGLL